MAEITVVGPGAIGGTVFAWLSQDPRHRMTLAARDPLDRLDVQTPQGNLTVRPSVVTNPSLAKRADWVLIATKAYDVVGASHWLEHSCSSSTMVAVLQNGV